MAAVCRHLQNNIVLDNASEQASGTISRTMQTAERNGNMKQTIGVNTKRIMAGVIAAVLILLAFPVYSMADGTPRLVVSGEKASVGEQVVVKVSTENNPGVMAMILGIDYDKSKLECIGVEDGGLTGWTYNGKAVWVGSDDSSYNGVILKLKFRVLDTAENGLATVKVSYSNGDICNYDEKTVAFNTVNGGVTVSGGSKTASGDTNTPKANPSDNAKAKDNPAKESQPTASDAVKTDKADKAGKVDNGEKTDKAEINGNTESADSKAANNDKNDGGIAPEASKDEVSNANALPFVIAGAAVLVAALLIILLKKKERK